MKLRSAAIALSISAAAVAASAQANSFRLVNKSGRTIGKASYSIDKTKDGYKVKARFEYRMGIAADTDTSDLSAAPSTSSSVTDNQFSSEYKVDANGDYLSGFTLNGSTQTLSYFTPSKTRDSIVIGQTQGGVGLGSKDLPMPLPSFLVAPDYDPSAMQVLLTGALAHPHSDHLYLLAVPSSGGRSLNNALYVTIADPTDATGTLDGKPFTLKRYALGWNKAKGALYADADGTLMQADIGTINISYIRAKFKLDTASAQ